MERGDLGDQIAEEFLTQVIKKNPHALEFYQRLLALYEKQGRDYDMGFTALEMISRNPFDEEAHLIFEKYCGFRENVLAGNTQTKDMLMPEKESPAKGYIDEMVEIPPPPGFQDEEITGSHLPDVDTDQQYDV